MVRHHPAQPFHRQLFHARYQGGTIEDAPIVATAEQLPQGSVVELDQTLGLLDDLAPKRR